MSDISTRRLQEGFSWNRRQPHLWEDFPFLTRYYGGLRSLVLREENVPEYPRSEKEATSTATHQDSSHPPRDEQSFTGKPFNPYPDYDSAEYLLKHHSVKDCLTNTSLNTPIPSIRAYDGVPKGFPDAVMGSYKLLGLRDDICFERFGRLGPYGLGYGIRNGGTGVGLHGDRTGVEEIWGEAGLVNFNGVRWAKLQEACQIANDHRFHKPRIIATGSSAIAEMDSTFMNGSVLDNNQDHRLNDTSKVSGEKSIPRTAFLIRTWDSFEYTPEDILFLRSLITELSLLSGGEFDVRLLVHIKDDNLQIWADEELHEKVLRAVLPEEFWGLGILWTERQMGLIYGGLEETMYRHLPVHGVYRSLFMPVQWFAHKHPEYDFFWQWEMDARYTGHYYDLVDKVAKWAKAQPRKGLWERNGRFYIPSVHGSWEDFKQMVRVQTEMGNNDPRTVWGPETGRHALKNTIEKPIWGPERPPSESDHTSPEYDETPPTTYQNDDYQWGVGEEADLINFNPMFDPDQTTWLLADDITGYNRSAGLPPRRASTITLSRLSRRLLHTMHHETAMKRHTMFSEMWPATCALHHGYKAVYVPHPVYIDRDWPVAYLAGVFNGGRNGATGGARTSVFGDREHNFLGTTWYYNAGFSGVLWRRWLGLRVDNNGGEEVEMAGEGRMCLPGVLLHPIKTVKLIVEGSDGNGHVIVER